MSHVKQFTVPVGGKKPAPPSEQIVPGTNGKLSHNNNNSTNNINNNDNSSTNGQLHNSSSDAPKLPPKPVREQVRVIFSYQAQNDDELTIKEGDLITVISKDNEDVGWWKGELNGRIALFPDNFIEPYQPQAPPPTGVRSVTAEMNSTAPTAGPPPATGEKPGLKKPERPSSLAKPSLSNNNNGNDELSPAVTPTSPASPAPNSVASKKLKFAQLSQFQQNLPQPVQPKPTSLADKQANANNNLSNNSASKDLDEAKKQPPKAGDNATSPSETEPGRLVHLTTLRPKIPAANRRPPSMPPRGSSMIEDLSPSSPLDGPQNGNDLSPTKDVTENGGVAISAQPLEKKTVPWLNDLVMAQKRRNPVKPPAPTAGSSATTNAISSAQTTVVPPTQVVTEPKPVTSNKPSLSSSTKSSLSSLNNQPVSGDDDSSTAPSNTTSSVTTSSQVTNKYTPAPVSSGNPANTSAGNNVSISAKDLEAITELKEQNSTLKSEMKELKNKYDKLESLVSGLSNSLMSQGELMAQKTALETLVSNLFSFSNSAILILFLYSPDSGTERLSGRSEADIVRYDKGTDKREFRQ